MVANWRPLREGQVEGGGTAAAPMRAAFFRAHGGLDVLEVGDMDDPRPGPGEVAIAVKACALNHLDLFVRQGWPGLQLALPHIGGTDLAGTVTEVSEGVTDFHVGDAVVVNPGLNFDADEQGEQVVPAAPSIVGETRAGGLAERCVVPASHVLPRPAGLSWEEAACLPLTLQTVMQMMRRGGLAGTGPSQELSALIAADAARPAAGKRVLVVGGGGGVSVIAIQIAKALGAWVCATTGGADKVEHVRGLGADEVIDYQANAEWWKAAYFATGKEGFDVVLDSVGQATWKHSLRCLRPGGRLVTCGATTGAVGETNIQLLFWKQLSILGSTMGTPDDLARGLALVQAGKVRPVVDSVWPLAQAREAQAHLASGAMFGKVVVRP